MDRSDLHEWLSLESKDAIIAAVNNFEPLAERCKRAEAALERFARSLERAGKDMCDLVGENKRLTRQCKQLVLSLQRIEREYYGTGAEIIAINALRSVKGGADGKA